MRDPKQSNSNGFTLVELLITITVLAVLAVIVIPSLRMLTRDRKVRETARVVGAMFAAAREQAAIDGMAGVEIVHNANRGLENMGMTLYRLRSLPPYSGDVFDHVAVVTDVANPYYDTTNNREVAGQATVTFYQENKASPPPTPLPLFRKIEAGDYLELNQSGVLYLVTNSGVASITIELRLSDPLPPTDPGMATPEVMVPFKFHLQPIRVESSVTTLPNRLFINLAFSGHGNAGNQCWDYPLQAPPAPPFPVGSTQVWFNRDGSVDRVTSRRRTAPFLSSMDPPEGPIYFLICTGDGDDVNLMALDDVQFIENDNNLWVVIDQSTGNVSVGRMANIDPASTTLAQKIRDSRQLANNRQSATP